jgi:hypothetical protein
VDRAYINTLIPLLSDNMRVRIVKESILVTGGDGNIGSEVIKQLSSTGADLGVKWHVTRLLQY